MMKQVMNKTLTIAIVSGLMASQAVAVLPTPTEGNQLVEFPKYTSVNKAQPISNGQKSLNDIASQNTLPVKTYSNIDRKMTASLVKTVNGQETLMPVTANTKVKSGDIIQYQGQFTNNSPDRVRSMKVSLSIPKGVELVGEVSPKLAKGSSNAKDFYYMPLKANIGGVRQELPLSYYRALRWEIKDLPTGTSTLVSYRVRMK